jgi:hypothetical protein
VLKAYNELVYQPLEAKEGDYVVQPNIAVSFQPQITPNYGGKTKPLVTYSQFKGRKDNRDTQPHSFV